MLIYQRRGRKIIPDSHIIEELYEVKIVLIHHYLIKCHPPGRRLITTLLLHPPHHILGRLRGSRALITHLVQLFLLLLPAAATLCRWYFPTCTFWLHQSWIITGALVREESVSDRLDHDLPFSLFGIGLICGCG